MHPPHLADPVADLAAAVVEASGITTGQAVLDVAAGAGFAAVRAALLGARVVATELSAPLVMAGRRAATDAGLDLEWVEADTAALPFADGEFDAVVSVLGATVAPYPQQTADELIRVCRLGGIVALATDTRPGAPWGRPHHVRALFGHRVSGLRIRPAGARTDLRRYLIVVATREGGPTMSRQMIDCRAVPNEVGCTLAISGEPDEVVAAAVQHATHVHGHTDTAELRSMLRSALVDEDAARA